MRYQLLSLSCAFFGGILLRTAGASCYYPDGSFPTDYVYVPCSGDEFTSCCIMSEGDMCLSNGLCQYPGYYSFRGACSDKTWNSPNCFQHCKNSTNSYADSYDQIVQCGGDRYCCNSDGSTCCNDDSKVFKLGSPTVIKDLATTTRRSTPALPFPTVAPTGMAAMTSQKATTTATGGAPANTNANAAATSTSTSSSSSSSQADTGTHTFSRTTIIAVSVAGLVAFAVIVTLFWFFIRRHYRKKMAAGNREQAFPMSSDGFQKLQDKSPRPVEVPAPLHSPAPPYQPPAYQNSYHTSPYATNGAVEIDNSYLPPRTNQYGQPVFEAPAQPFRHT